MSRKSPSNYVDIQVANNMLDNAEDERDQLAERVRELEAERDRYCKQSENNSLELLETQQECLQLIDERDHREEQINQIADVLGDSSEWSNVNDRGYNAIELASDLREQVKVLREALERYAHIPIANDERNASSAPSNQNFIAREALEKVKCT